MLFKTHFKLNLSPSKHIVELSLPSDNLKSNPVKWLLTLEYGLLWCRSKIKAAHTNLSEAEKLLDLSQCISLTFSLHQSSSSNLHSKLKSLMVLSVSSLRPEFGQAKPFWHCSHEAANILQLALMKWKRMARKAPASPLILPVACWDGNPKDWGVWLGSSGNLFH